MIVDDITCEKLIGHTVDLIVDAYPDKADPAKRQKNIDACEERYKATPPVESDQQQASLILTFKIYLISLRHAKSARVRVDLRRWLLHGRHRRHELGASRQR